MCTVKNELNLLNSKIVKRGQNELSVKDFKNSKYLNDQHDFLSGDLEERKYNKIQISSSLKWK